MHPPCPVIDAHTHLWPERTDRDAAALIEMADRFGLEQVWVSALFGGHHPGPAALDAGNAAARRLAERDARFRVWVRVEPAHGRHMLQTVDRLVRDGPGIGVKVWLHPADSPEIDPLLERLAAWGRPLLIHAWRKATGNYPGESEPAQVAALARRHPRARILMPHLGGDWLHGCEAIRACPNVWADICGTICERDMVPTAVRTLGARRVVFGTDAPAVSFLNNLAKVLAEPLGRPTVERILHRNARELLA